MYQFPFSKEEMVHLTELVVYFSHSNNERIAGIAEELLPFVINCTDLGTVPIQVKLKGNI